MKIYNEGLSKCIAYQIGKYNQRDFSIEELESVREIGINKKDLRGNVIDIDIKEIDVLKNLKILYLSNFVISDWEIENIKKCENMVSLCLELCEIKDITEEKDMSYLKNILIKLCDLESLNKILLPNHVIFQNCDIDLKKIINPTNITVLELKNCNIQNSNLLDNFKKLERIVLDGSRIDSIDIIDKLKRKTIVSFKDKYHNNA